MPCAVGKEHFTIAPTTGGPVTRAGRICARRAVQAICLPAWIRVRHQLWRPVSFEAGPYVVKVMAPIWCTFPMPLGTAGREIEGRHVNQPWPVAVHRREGAPSVPKALA